MRKITLFFWAVAAIMLSACELTDKDKEDDEIRSDTDCLYISGTRVASTDGTLPENTKWKIGPNVVAKSSKTIDADETKTGIKGKVSEILSDAPRRTTIYAENGNEFMAISYNGKDSKDIPYSMDKIGGRVPQLLFDYIETGTLTDDMKNLFGFDAFIVYKSDKTADAESGNVWISTECTINPSPMLVKGVSYIQGTFTAKFQNKQGDTFILSPAAFSCLSY